MITSTQKHRRLAMAFASLFLAMPALAATAPADAPLFERDIRPILKTHCFHCHGEEDELKGDLDVRLRRFLEKGGESGPAIVPGDPAASHLLELLKNGEMPKEKAKLPDRDIALFEKWIAAGAPTARPEPETLGPEHLFTEEERAWWSFQPLAKISVPKPDPTTAKNIRNPIDNFIAEKLVPNKLTFSPEADPATLIRRATFDLTGLPPTPEEVDAFLKASAANPDKAFTDLIDRLLTSPAYGERWGRHWLDVAGYADSDGYSTKDLERAHAWKYRDYVIRALNADKPFDVFIREQLAGDEIAAEEGLDANAPKGPKRDRHTDLLVATGFLRMAPDGTGAGNDITARNTNVSDTMKILSTALYGMTIGCAECHDHRYDAISQADYFRLRAIFEPGFDMKKWRTPAKRLVSLQTKEEAAAAAKVEVEAKKIDAARLEKQKEFIAEVLEKLLANCDEKIRDDLRKAYLTETKKRTPEQLKLLKDNPSVNKLSSGSLYLYDSKYKTKHADTLKKMAAEAAEVRKKKPVHQYAHAFTEVAVKPEAIPETRIHYRGNPESPKGDPLEPSDLSVLAAHREVSIPANNEALPSSGRRLAYARSITDGKHPLLPRVTVNRIWMHHFGKGLVASAGDFGALGETPSHPELLDWLSAEFVRKRWSLKELHRLILSSHTWRQQSRRDSTRETIDPDNRLLSRQNVRRLEAETLRDALLSVTGKLNPDHYGEPVPVMYNTEGLIVIGEDTTDTAGRQTGKFISLDGKEFRRSIYVQIRRTRPLEMFSTFDAPDMMNPNCEIRPVTTVSPQSLLLMNSSAMREHASHFAQRLVEEEKTLPEQATRAWRLAYGHSPSEDDLAAAVKFVTDQTAWYKDNPAKFEKSAGPLEKENAPPELLGLGALCHALVSANEFLYID